MDLRLLDEIVQFMDHSLPDFLVQEVKDLDLSNLPEWLQKLIKDSAPSVVPAAVRIALEYIYSLQEPFLLRSSIEPVAEMDGIATGVCSTRSECDIGKMISTIRASNLFPDLVRMQCSMLGAWGKANAPGSPNLIQLRSLDFGAGPFPNASTIIVQHPTNGNPFVSLSFPGFTGVVTGVSSKISLSEKVWMVSGAPGSLPPNSPVFSSIARSNA